MKITVLKKSHLEKNINIAELQKIDMSLEKIMEDEIGSPMVLHMPGINWTRKIKHSDNDERNTRPGTIEFFDGKGQRHEIEKGVLFYKSFAELVDFVAERIDPQGKGMLSDVTRRARGFDGTVHKEKIEAEIGKGNRNRRRAFSRKVGLPLEEVSDTDVDEYVSVRTGEEPAYAWHLYVGLCDLVLLAEKDFRELDGHRVPYFKFIKPIHSLCPDPEELDGMDFLLYDGEVHTWHQTIEEIQPDVLAEIEEHGEMYYTSDFDILPMEHLEPLCAVRIPPREEMKTHIEEFGASINGTRPPHRLLNDPGLLFDSHYPIPLPQGTKVIDDPRAALWILSKTVRGIYSPRKKAGMFPVKKIPIEETFQVLTRPRRMTV